MNKKELEKKILKIKSKTDYLLPSDPKVHSEIIKRMIAPFRKTKVNKVVSMDMKGLMYGPIIAHKLKVPFVPILKGDKIKNRKLVTKSKGFLNYCASKSSVEIFKGSIKKTDRILIVDDWFESGNTGQATISMIEKTGAKVVGISTIFNQLKPKKEEFFDKYNYHFIVQLKYREACPD